MPEDLALRLLRQGYAALPLSRPIGSVTDSHPARLLGRRAVVLRGASGARLFYDTSAVRREGAVPRVLADLLFGRGAVHGLDGAEHADRKALFLETVRLPEVDDLADRVARGLADRAASWRVGEQVVLFDELVEVYGTAVLAWAGVDLAPDRAREASRDLARIVDGFGGRPPAYARAWAARRRCESWARAAVVDARTGHREPRHGSALDVVARSDLDLRTAAVELLNVLRPTVAVAWFGSFAGLALDEHPEWRARLRSDTGSRYLFAEEVRRFYPFVPALAGRTRRVLTWDGRRLPAGTRLVLDVRGINLDERTFADAERFDPLRPSRPDPYQLLPQGGGHPETGHRCPGENVTLRLLDQTLAVLAGLDLEVVSVRRVPIRRIPTRPERGLVLRVRDPS